MLSTERTGTLKLVKRTSSTLLPLFFLWLGGGSLLETSSVFVVFCLPRSCNIKKKGLFKLRNLVRLCPLPLKTPLPKALNYSSVVGCYMWHVRSSVCETKVFLHWNTGLMISGEVASSIVYLVHMDPVYFLFMKLSVVDVIVMQILFATFREQ